ncbi:MAG: hypothetical protein QM698_11515 [Micropepsaceae bacterium]
MTTKQEAAAAQIDAAIQMLRAGNLCAAITLSQAGANCIPDGREIWDKMQGVYNDAQVQCDAKASVWLNEAANWLKHCNSNTTRSHEFEISSEEARIYVWRGIATFRTVYGEDTLTSTMDDFMRKDWQDFVRECESQKRR